MARTKQNQRKQPPSQETVERRNRIIGKSDGYRTDIKARKLERRLQTLIEDKAKRYAKNNAGNLKGYDVDVDIQVKVSVQLKKRETTEEVKQDHVHTEADVYIPNEVIHEMEANEVVAETEAVAVANEVEDDIYEFFAIV